MIQLNTPKLPVQFASKAPENKDGCKTGCGCDHGSKDLIQLGGGTKPTGAPEGPTCSPVKEAHTHNDDHSCCGGHDHAPKKRGFFAPVMDAISWVGEVIKGFYQQIKALIFGSGEAAPKA